MSYVRLTESLYNVFYRLTAKRQVTSLRLGIQALNKTIWTGYLPFQAYSIKIKCTVSGNQTATSRLSTTRIALA